MNQHREVQMKQSNNQVGEKVLVLGAGQLGASVLA
ncbi:aromatic alcohol reductase, partial [Salmonella enterica]|nr:aromatic alcohol reductase [Salmonella enterica]